MKSMKNRPPQYVGLEVEDRFHWASLSSDKAERYSPLPTHNKFGEICLHRRPYRRNKVYPVSTSCP